jgi:hypothetical protein
MDYQDYPVWHSPLDTGWSYAARLGFQTAGIREAQSTLGNSDTDNPLFRLNIVPAVSPSNIEPGLSPG